MAVGCGCHVSAALVPRSSSNSSCTSTTTRPAPTRLHSRKPPSRHAAMSGTALALVDAAVASAAAAGPKEAPSGRCSIVAVRRRAWQHRRDIRATAAAASGSESPDHSASWRSYDPDSSFDPDAYQQFDDDDTELDGSAPPRALRSTGPDAPKWGASAASSNSSGGVGRGDQDQPGGVEKAARKQAAHAASGSISSAAASSSGLGGSHPEGPVDMFVSATVSAWMWLIALLMRALGAAKGRALAAGKAMVRPLLGVIPRGTRRQLRQLVSWSRGVSRGFLERVYMSWGVAALHVLAGVLRLWSMQDCG